MRLFINALGASCASGFTYLRNVIPELAQAAGIETVLAATPAIRPEFKDLSNVSFVDIAVPTNAVRRFWFEQRDLPGEITRCGADVLLSTGNFALRHSPVPQILLSGNSLYTSREFSQDLRSRKAYGTWLDNRVKAAFGRASIGWADRTIAPSQAFASDLERWSGKKVDCLYHGFSPQLFFTETEPLAVDIQRKLDSAEGALRLLFVSHYNYYRNFETLLRAIALVRRHLPHRKIRLFLTCEFQAGKNPGSYNPDKAAALVRELGILEQVVELGAIPYRALHHIYRAADIYVTPAYAETFAHPLVEAMASGIPIVASDLNVHREICGDAALYFARFLAEELAGQIVRLALSNELRRSLAQRGLNRSHDFSWIEHVSELLKIADALVREKQSATRPLPVSNRTLIESSEFKTLVTGDRSLAQP